METKAGLHSGGSSHTSICYLLSESSLSTHGKVEYDWKVSAWAGRKKVKDTWGLVVLKGGKLGDAVVGMEELWERIIVS